MKERFEEEIDTIINGNVKADELAEKGRQEENEMHIAHNSASIALDTPKGKISSGIRGVIKEELQNQNTNRAIKKRTTLREAMKGPNVAFFKDLDPKQASLRIFYFRLIHDKFPTPAKILKRGNQQAEKLQTTKCTFGCDTVESIEHILECEKNPKFEEEEDILKVLQKIDKTYEWKNKTLWYHHPQRTTPTPHVPELENITKNKTLGDKGILPSNLTDWINSKQPEQSEDLIKELQITILKRAKSLWKERCSEHHKNKRKREEEEKEEAKKKKELQRAANRERKRPAQDTEATHPNTPTPKKPKRNQSKPKKKAEMKKKKTPTSKPVKRRREPQEIVEDPEMTQPPKPKKRLTNPNVKRNKPEAIT